MKNLMTLCLFLSFSVVAHADNNGLVVDAEARGYSIEISDVAFGNSGLTLFKPGVRVSVKNILKNGKAIPSAAGSGSDSERDHNLMAEANGLCLDMFSTPERIEKFEISGVGYGSANTILSVECLFNNR